MQHYDSTSVQPTEMRPAEHSCTCDIDPISTASSAVYVVRKLFLHLRNRALSPSNLSGMRVRCAGMLWGRGLDQAGITSGSASEISFVRTPGSTHSLPMVCGMCLCFARTLSMASRPRSRTSILGPKERRTKWWHGEWKRFRWRRGRRQCVGVALCGRRCVWAKIGLSTGLEKEVSGHEEEHDIPAEKG
jgi:hypothetical protein